MQSSRRPPTDSPWFWVGLFAVAGLIGLALISTKYGKRQAQIEREFQGRQRAAQNAQGQSPDIPLSTPNDTLIQLWPLVLVCVVLIPISFLILYRRHSKPTSPADP